jgi:hypothetical protein
MARVDVMYGVTMQEFGVSKPVGMRLTAAEKEGSGNGKVQGDQTPVAGIQAEAR